MSIEPEGEDLRKAVKWISAHREDDPDQGMQTLVEAASLRFNLSPKDEMFLLKWLAKETG